MIQSIASGDNKAFHLLYDLYAEIIFNTALSYVKNKEEAEDITQDVFIKICKYAASFKGKSSVKTWIYRIVVNTSLNHLKKKTRFTIYKHSLSDSQSIDFVHPGVLLENKENSIALYKAMDCLSDHQKTAFILSYIEDLPRQEVADIMTISLKAVESLLQRAKKNMRLELEKMYPYRRKVKK
ncbi:MAG: RNA polymerase sigma factor [Bacteroidota bacterium]